MDEVNYGLEIDDPSPTHDQLIVDEMDLVDDVTLNVTSPDVSTDNSSDEDNASDSGTDGDEREGGETGLGESGL